MFNQFYPSKFTGTIRPTNRAKNVQLYQDELTFSTRDIMLEVNMYYQSGITEISTIEKLNRRYCGRD